MEPFIQIEVHIVSNSICRTDRLCKETTVINGVTIPKGVAIMVPIAVIHHSPLYWEEPEKFDPDR